MTNQTANIGEGRARLSLRVVIAGLFGLMIALSGQRLASAHAEPERAIPPISGTVDTVPAIVEIWFDEEVGSEGTTIQVIGPGGIQVDLGDATVDLQDAERKHVTVSLRSGLEPGTYTVQWTSLSVTDGDEAKGGYIFTVGSATPAASPVATPMGSATGESSASDPVTPVNTPVTSASTENGDFDSLGFGLSIAAGLGIAVLIFIFWRAVRPKNPKF